MPQRGSTRKRGTTWTAYFFVPGPDGARVQKSKGGFRTQRDARAFLTETLAEVQKGAWAEPRKITVRDFLVDHWLPTVDRRASTLSSYKMVIEAWLVPQIGDIWLPALTAADIQRAVAQMRAEGGRGQTELSGRSVQLAFTVVRKALQYAVTVGFIPRNPSVGLSRPAVVRKEMNCWTLEQTRTFLDHVAGDRLAALYALALLRGPRRGELAGLRWDDVTLDGANRRLRIVRTRVMVDGHVIDSAPKTKAGRRTVPIDNYLADVLRAHRERQLFERRTWGEAWTDTGYVFVKEDGTPPPPEYFTTAFERRLKESGLPSIRFHDMRHTCATLALQAGERTEVVSRWLGHATVSITQDLYQHAIPSMLEDAGARLTQLVVG